MNRKERRAAAARLRAMPVCNGSFVIDRREVPEGKCDFCGNDAELRPYGPNGEWVCFTCGMKDEKAAAAQFRKHVFGETTN